MNVYTLQSYFKSLCDSFYIAYAEVKRLEIGLEEVDSTVEEETLEKVKEVLTAMEDTESPIHKYINFKHTELEMEEEKARLEAIINQKNEKSESIGEEKKVWSKWMWNLKEQIYRALLQISREKQTIIITSKEEIYALMFVYRSEGTIRVLNTKEEYLISYPKNDKICYDFLENYLGGNEKKMKEFYEENI